MPDFATHHLFGDKLELPAAAAAYPALFHWGLQGPDLLFYRKALQGAPYHTTGGRMHEEATAALFAAMSDYCGQCAGEEKRRAEAYMYGFAGHYALDSTCHPYVFWQQQRLAAENPKASAAALHCGIESDMDMDIFGYLQGRSACTLDLEGGYKMPADCQKTVGAFYTHLLYKVYHLLVSPAEIVAALQDTLALQKLLFSGNKLLLGAARALGTLQGKGGDYYAAHLKGRQPRWDSLNLNQHSWENPWNGQPSQQSVPQLMDAAAERFHQLCGALERNAAGARLPIPISMDFSGKELQSAGCVTV